MNQNTITLADDVIEENGQEVKVKVAVCSCGTGEGMWHYFIMNGKMKLQCVMCASTFDFPS